MQLFLRRPRALKLTDAGRAFLEDLLPVLEDLDTIIERNSERRSQLVHRPSTTASAWFPAASYPT